MATIARKLTYVAVGGGAVAFALDQLRAKPLFSRRFALSHHRHFSPRSFSSAAPTPAMLTTINANGEEVCDCGPLYVFDILRIIPPTRWACMQEKGLENCHALEVQLRSCMANQKAKTA